MKRTLVATMVVGLLATAAPAVITHLITPMGSYTVGIGTGPTVDMYKVTLTVEDPNNPELKLGSLVFWVGDYAGDPCLAQGIPIDPNDPNQYDNPFQGAWRAGGKTPVTNLTPTWDDANMFLTPPDSSKLFESDSNFLPLGIGSSSEWPTGTVSPFENNDSSIYSAGDDDYRAGVGGMGVAKAIPPLKRVTSIDAIMVGVIRGTTVYCYTGSADENGITTKERFRVWVIPEPATMSVLAVGVLGLLGRRRRT